MSDPKNPSGEFPATPSPDAVPVGFAVQKLKKGAEVDFKDPKAMETMRNQQVEVHANGIVYKGLLTGTDGEELYLRTELRHISIMMDRVTRIIPASQKPPPLAQGSVTQEFYAPLPGEEDSKSGKS
jgi:hypothetical protein